MAKKKKKSSNIKVLLLAVLGVFLLSGAIFGYHFYSYIKLANVKMNQDEAVFFISSSWGYARVAEELKTQGIISNPESFDWVAQKKNYPNKIKPGKYIIKNGWSNEELVDILRSGKQSPIKLTFHNISHISQLAAKVADQIEADSTALMNAFFDAKWLTKNGFTKQTVPAIFIPNTYEMYWNTSATQFVSRMQKEFEHFWSVENKKLAKNMGLNPFEISTLASIVEAETKKKDEMPKVAGLYVNRLTIGMRLQSDPTVVFALNKPGIQRVYYEDLKIKSPYNTYIHSGLPPGPIGFPSTTALKAVLNCYKSNYLYMCAKPDYSGYHNFASSYSKHTRNAQIYRAFLKKEGIR